MRLDIAKGWGEKKGKLPPALMLQAMGESSDPHTSCKVKVQILLPA